MALRLYLLSVLAAALSLHASGEVLISQYYEGASFNKWIELSNTDAVAISLDGFVLTRWANAATEEWKQDGASPRYHVNRRHRLPVSDTEERQG